MYKIPESEKLAYRIQLTLDQAKPSCTGRNTTDEVLSQKIINILANRKKYQEWVANVPSWNKCSFALSPDWTLMLVRLMK